MKINTSTTFGLLVSALLLCCGATANALQQIDKIAAVVNDDVVLESELQERIAQAKANFARANAAPPPDSELRRGVLDRMILESIQLQRGLRAGVRVSDEQLNAAIAAVAQQQGMSLESFRDKLLQSGSYYAMQAQIRDEIIIQQVQSGSLNRLVNVSPDELDAFLASPEGQSLAQTRYLLSHLMVPVDSDASASTQRQARTIAESARQEIANGKNAERWAKVFNLRNNSNVQAGTLNWRTLEELPSLFADVAKDMTVGDISPVLEAGNGLHLLQLLDVSNKARLIEQRQGRHILIKPSAILDNDAAFEAAYALRARAISGEDFGELAKQHSEDIGTAAEGGSLGWSRPGMFVPEFEAALLNTPVGDISEPVRTQFGWHIILVEATRETDMSDDILKNRAYSVLRERKFDDVRDEWLQQLRNGAYVDIK